MSKGIKLHDLTPEKVGIQPPPPKPLDIKTPAPFDPRNPTRDQALAALRSAYKVLVKGSPASPAVLANRLIAPAILYLESLDHEQSA
jgi:hypothetical protein